MRDIEEIIQDQDLRKVTQIEGDNHNPKKGKGKKD